MTEMEDAKYIDLIAKYLSGNIEPGEKQELLAWVDASDANRAYFDEMIQLWGISENYESHFEADLQTAWQSLNRKLPKAEADIENNGKVIRFPMWLRVAASVVLLLGLGYWWYVNPAADPGRLVEIQTAEGETQNIILPDGSTVWLNENTTFSYMDKFEVRQVNLNGEAFFQVDRQEENPFIILSGEATTTVLGTSFNVRAYPDEPAVEVTVESGKVALKKNLPAEAEEIILAAGESGVYDKQEKTVRGVEEKIINADSWKTRTLEFPNMRMNEVVQTLERYYDIEIKVDNPAILNCRWVMGKEENPPVDLVLEMLEFSMNYQVERTDANTFTLNGQGCN